MKTTNSKKKFLALFLSVVLLIISIPAYAESGTDNSDEHVFTFEELAGMDCPQNPLLPDDGTFVPVNKVEGETARTSGARATASTTTEYYIIEKADGYLLTSPSSGAFSRTRYSSGNSNSHNLQKWKFKSYNNDGIYIVYSATDDTKCLTVNPTTKAVTLTTYVASQYQNWKMYYSSNGNALASTANDTSVNGYKLVIGASSCSVSNSAYTPVGFFQVERYVPVTKLTYKNFWLAPQQSRYVEPTKTPSDANGGRGSWVNWSISPSNALSAVVSSEGKVTGGSPYNSAQLTFTDKITRVSGSCYITITEISNGTYFIKNRQSTYYARVKDDTLTNGQNVVQHSLVGDNAEHWIFNLNSDTGYYSIKTAKSGSTAYYLAVSDDATTQNKPVVIRSATESTLTDGMKWRIEKTTNGAYKLCPKTGEANGYVLATTTSNATNNKNLIQGAYVQNTSYRDEWLLNHTTLDCWYSDSNEVAYWASSPTLYVDNNYNMPTFYFNSGVNSAKSQWTSALSISMQSSTQELARIKCYGSTAADLYTRFGVVFDDNCGGLTYTTYVSNSVSTTYWGGNRKTIRQLNRATIYVPYKEISYSDQIDTVVHEFGHALGYLGHSSSKTDVMYYKVQSSYTLKASDISHLAQFYN